MASAPARIVVTASLPLIDGGARVRAGWWPQRPPPVRARPALQDGSFAAESIWVNIVNLHAEVVGVDAGTLYFRHHGEAWIGHLQPDTVARCSMRAHSRDLSGVAASQHAQIVGAWRPGTNGVDVSTVFA